MGTGLGNETRLLKMKRESLKIARLQEVMKKKNQYYKF